MYLYPPNFCIRRSRQIGTLKLIDLYCVIWRDLLNQDGGHPARPKVAPAKWRTVISYRFVKMACAEGAGAGCGAAASARLQACVAPATCPQPAPTEVHHTLATPALLVHDVDAIFHAYPPNAFPQTKPILSWRARCKHTSVCHGHSETEYRVLILN